MQFKGRSTLKQYAKKKTVEWEKIWTAADASNGYVNNLDVHRQERRQHRKGLGASVSKSLTAVLHHLYCHIFFDSFFSSVNLPFDLRSKLMGAEH